MKIFQIAFVAIFVFILSTVLTGEEKKIFKVDAPKCVGCKLCVPVCPTKAITMKGTKAVIDPEKCVGCGLCEPKCPVKAISTDKKKNEVENETAQNKVETAPKSIEPTSKVVYFIQKKDCTGCKECVPVCPTKAITMKSGKAVIDPEKCINCGLCAKACSFGAPVKKEVKK